MGGVGGRSGWESGGWDEWVGLVGGRRRWGIRVG